MKYMLTGSYPFDPAAKTINFTSVSGFNLKSLIAIVNQTAGVVIYNPVSPSAGGTLAGSVLTLAYDTTAMHSGDTLLVFYDEQVGGGKTLKDIWDELASTLSVSDSAVRTTLGEKTDAAATDSTSSWSLTALAKGILAVAQAMQIWWSNRLGIKTSANSLSMTGASDASFKVADGDNAALGAKADAAATDSTSSWSLISIGKGILGALLGTLKVGGVTADGLAPTSQAVRVGGIDGGGLKRTLLTDTTGRQYVVMPDSTQTNMTFNSASDIYTFDMTNYQSWSIQITTPGSNNSLTWEFQDDGSSSSWISGIAQGYTSNGTLFFGTGVNPATYASICGQKRGRYMRIRCSIFGTGPVVAKFTQMSSNLPGVVGAAVAGFSAEGNSTLPNPVVFGIEVRTASKTSLSNGTVGRAVGTQDGRIVIRPNSIPENEWVYAAASGGIASSNAEITVKSAAGANVRNYMTSCQISADSLASATEIVIKEDASGTVLWRMKIQTGGLPVTTIRFDDPLKSLANKPLIVQLTTSNSGAVYFNAQGYIAP